MKPTWWILMFLGAACLASASAASQRVPLGTRGIALGTRGVPLGTRGVPLGLPAVEVPVSNPLTSPKIALGRMLYFDKRLSVNGTVACATCHDPQHGWSDPRPTSVGVQRQIGSRHAPTIVNAAYSKLQFWDGRAQDLEEQALVPIANPIEMGNTHEHMVATVTGIEGYRLRFEETFGGPPTPLRVAQALASFERTILSGNSAYDHYRAGDGTALTEPARRGMHLFFGTARCNACHSGATFSDGRFHRLAGSLPSKGNAILPRAALGPRDAILPRDAIGPQDAILARDYDAGREEITHDARDRGAFKTPGLRDVSRRPPYLHDGSAATLEQAIKRHFVRTRAPGKHDLEDLIGFLESLNGIPEPLVSAPPLPP